MLFQPNILLLSLIPLTFSYILQHTYESCDWDIYDCFIPYDIQFTYKFVCYHNLDCPANFKCCRHRCFRHNICQPIRFLTEPPSQVTMQWDEHPGECDILLSCGIDLPRSFTERFMCLRDADCPEHFKCCYIECYQHNVCQPAKNEWDFSLTTTNIIENSTSVTSEENTVPVEVSTEEVLTADTITDDSTETHTITDDSTISEDTATETSVESITAAADNDTDVSEISLDHTTTDDSTISEDAATETTVESITAATDNDTDVSEISLDHITTDNSTISEDTSTESTVESTPAAADKDTDVLETSISTEMSFGITKSISVDVTPTLLTDTPTDGIWNHENTSFSREPTDDEDDIEGSGSKRTEGVTDINGVEEILEGVEITTTSVTGKEETTIADEEINEDEVEATTVKSQTTINVTSSVQSETNTTKIPSTVQAIPSDIDFIFQGSGDGGDESTTIKFLEVTNKTTEANLSTDSPIESSGDYIFEDDEEGSAVN